MERKLTPEAEEEEEVQHLHTPGVPFWGLDIGQGDLVAGLDVAGFVLLSGGHLLVLSADQQTELWL